jgi:hypothetical protein
VRAYQDQSGAEWVSGADSVPPPSGGDTG